MDGQHSTKQRSSADGEWTAAADQRGKVDANVSRVCSLTSQRRVRTVTVTAIVTVGASKDLWCG